MNQESRGGEEGRGGASTVKGNKKRETYGIKKREVRKWPNERKRKQESVSGPPAKKKKVSSQTTKNILIMICANIICIYCI